VADTIFDSLLVLAGILIVAWILWDVFQTVIVPRPTPTRIRLTRYLTRGMWRAWRWRGVHARSVDARERLLGGFAPLLVMALIASWVAFLILGYGVILFGLRGEITGQPGLGTSVYQAGITVLTIGYGDVVATGALSRLAEICAAGTGLGVVALGITYLFSLYGAFQRREELVTTLDARAGAPPSGVKMLETYARLGLWDDLPRTFAEWEVWEARVLDSQLAYPILNFFRSSHDGESWVSALGAVLDAAVLLSTTVEGGPAGRAVPSGQAIMTIKGGAHLVEDLGQFLGFPDDGSPMVERTEFDAACARLSAAGLRLRSDTDAAWGRFAGLRSSYASRLNQMAGYLLIPPTQWIGDRSALHHVARLQAAMAGASLPGKVQSAGKAEAIPERATTPGVAELPFPAPEISYLVDGEVAPSLAMASAAPDRDEVGAP
jgi:Ion channel